MTKYSYEYIITFGTVAGYNVDNNKKACKEEVIKSLMDIAIDIEQVTNIYLNGLLSDSTAIYKTEWGCPQNGEEIYEYKILTNPLFVRNSKEQIDQAVHLFANKVKYLYNQESVTYTCHRVEHECLN